MKTEDSFNRHRAPVFLAVVALASGWCAYVSQQSTYGAESPPVQPQVAPPASPVAEESLPKGKQTVVGLYLTAKQAFELWQASPDKVRIIDVRTPEEFIFVGHPDMALNIPVATQSYVWDAKKGKFPMEIQTNFVSRVSRVAMPEDTLLVMCRSGGRSAMAVNMLAEAGFRNVYNIVDGMEGDEVEDPDSVFQGQRLVNGWKNSGCPWTYKSTPDQMLLPEPKE